MTPRSTMSLHALTHHPDTPSTAIERVEVALDRDQRGAVRLTYRMLGDADRIVAGVPAEPPRWRDELWRRTCCELFVRDAGGSGYREYNFGPSGDWAAYRFSDYRAGRSPLDARARPRIELERLPAALILTATLPEQLLGGLQGAQRIGIACVVETVTELSYWALAHAHGPPDFHHECAFAITPAIDQTAYSANDVHP